MTTFPLQANGHSGQSYNFNVANLGHSFGSLPGIYVLLGRQRFGTTKALYVGQTADASVRPGPRCNGHHIESSARRLGLFAIGFLPVLNQRQRDVIERDLIEGLDPPLNVHHR